MADEPIAELGGKTPLEAARTPNLDRMASRGILGLTRTIPARLRSRRATVGTMSVLGYDPARTTRARRHRGRSLGVDLGPDDVAFAATW